MSNCYEIDWNLMPDVSIEEKEKSNFSHFVEIEWAKETEASKSKVSSDFSHLFGKRDGFHQMKPLEAYKLRDTLDYPSSMYKSIYESLEDDHYPIETNSSDDSDDSSSSDSSDDSSESES